MGYLYTQDYYEGVTRVNRNFFKQPFDECPKHDTCGSLCPLDISYFSNTGQKTSCTLAKNTRLVIARTHPGILVMGGLTKAEFNDMMHGKRGM
jgi:hypothetical protein